MRQGEILNPQWQDVDFTRGILVVMKSKNGTRRTIPLNAKVYELAAAKQAGTQATRGPVFRTPCGNELKVRYLVREFCEARDDAGIPDFRFHDMRHTFATRLVQRGGGSLQGAASTRAQDRLDDTALRASFAGEPERRCEGAGRPEAGKS
jgi:integrase